MVFTANPSSSLQELVLRFQNTWKSQNQPWDHIWKHFDFAPPVSKNQVFRQVVIFDMSHKYPSVAISILLVVSHRILGAMYSFSNKVIGALISLIIFKMVIQ